MHLEERLARQLIALGPHLDGEHVDEIVRPSIFEVALQVADLLRPDAAQEKILLFSGADVHAPSPELEGQPYRMYLRLDSEQEYDRSVLRGRGPGDPYYETVKREIPVRYLVDDGYAPMAWDWLVVWRAARIWIGLAGQIERLAGRTIFYEEEAGKPAVDPNTLAILGAAKDRVASMIVVEEVHSL